MSGPRASVPVLAGLAVVCAACSWTGSGSSETGEAIVIAERAAKYRGVGLGSSVDAVERAFGPGETTDGVAPEGKSPAEVGVPLVLATPKDAWPGMPRLLKYEDAVFLFAGAQGARYQVYTMMLTDSRLRTSRGVTIGDDIDEVRRRYSGVRCRAVAGGESLLGGQTTYPVCHVKLGPHQVLFFGGDPIGSFTFYARKLVSD